MAFLDPILNPILQPLLNLSPFWAVFILAFVITLIITLAYKVFTDQNEMKRLKTKQKDFQKQMKTLRDKPDEMMKIQKEAMKTNMEYMKQSFKVTLITFIPIILIFGWMNAHLAYEPIFPGERFSVTANFIDGVTGDVTLLGDAGVELLSEDSQSVTAGGVTWNLKSTAGMHFLTVKTDNDEQTKKVLVTQELQYEEPATFFEDSEIEMVGVNYKKLRPLGEFSIFGWEPGWLGWYIVFSIVFSIGLRKLLKIH
jgi:uncharacterized membrane protein (DUF106 family)